MSTMNLKETPTIQDIDAALGIMSRHSSEVLPELKLTLSEHIRRELATLLSAPNFKRELAQELMLINPVELDPNSEYVKLDDLKDIVGKLISRNVVGHSLATLEENSKKFGTAIKSMEQQMLKLTDRVDKLEMDMQELTICEDTTLTGKAMQPDKPSPRRLTESTDLKNSQLYIPGTKPEKLRIYNDLICKYQRKHSDSFSESSSVVRNTAFVPPLTKSKADDMWDESAPECTHLHEDVARRAAERRQFETNMLMYRKSQFSIKLNNRIDKTLLTNSYGKRDNLN